MKPINSLSVFFPVYNEAAALAQTIERALSALDTVGVTDYEVIIVDDGSQDGSAVLADGLARRHAKVRVVHHPSNRGYGAALMTGFDAATKEWVMYTDGDGQFDVADLAHFLPRAEDNDVVIGYRIHRQDHLGRKLNAWFWTMLVRLVIGLKVKDLDCGFKLIRRSALAQVQPLQARGAVISAELLTKLRRAGHPLAEVGVNHYTRVGGQPTGANLRVIARALGELFRLRRQLRAYAPRPR